MMETKALKKISIKNIMGGSGLKFMQPHIGKVVCAMSGTTHGYRVANSQYGESLGFQGQFVGINMLTGEAFTANEAFLPRNLEETLKARLEKAPNMDIEFQAEFLIAEHETQGFCYVSRPISTKESVQKHSAMLAGLVHATKPLFLVEGNAAETV